MKEFTLVRQEKREFKVNIDGSSYFLPMSGSLGMDEIKELDTVDGTVKFLKKHIPEKVFKTLTQDDYNAIVNAWIAASREDAGLSTGE